MPRRKASRAASAGPGRNDMLTAQDSVWMAQALQLAERGLYSTSPNPRVGCVLVKSNLLADST